MQKNLHDSCCVYSITTGDSNTSAIKINLSPSENTLVVGSTCNFETILTQQDCEYLIKLAKGKDFVFNWIIKGLALPTELDLRIPIEFTVCDTEHGGYQSVSQNDFIDKFVRGVGLDNVFSYNVSLDFPLVSVNAPPSVKLLLKCLQTTMKDLNTAVEQFRRSRDSTDYNRVISSVRQSLDKLKTFNKKSDPSRRIFSQTKKITDSGGEEAATEIINSMFFMMSELFNISSKSVHHRLS